MLSKNAIAADHERAGPLLRPRLRRPSSKSRSVLAFENMELQPEGAGRRLHVSRYGLGMAGLVGLTSRP